MCKNTFITTESQFETLVETLRDIHKEWTEAEVLDAAIRYADYFNSGRETRTAHIDISTPCMFHTNKDGSICGNGTQKKYAKENLEKMVGFKKPHGAKWHVAHLCENSSTAKHTCCNPEHIYFATPKENHNDIDRLGNATGVYKSHEVNRANNSGCFFNEKQRRKAQRKGGKVGGKAQLRMGTHNTLLKNKQCACCYRKFTALNIKQHQLSCFRNRLGLTPDEVKDRLNQLQSPA